MSLVCNWLKGQCNLFHVLVVHVGMRCSCVVCFAGARVA